jgi:phenylalanyl-tRNA synthetase beta chain
MKFSYNWLKELLSSIPSPAKTEELLTFHSYQVESSNKSGADTIFDIDLLPNRMPDSSGHIGVAREIATITNKKLKLPTPKRTKHGAPIKDKYSAELKTKSAYRYILGAVDNIKIKLSEKKIASRLESCGLRPINNIVDATNYIMLETGRPTHSFDADKVNGKIVVRQAEPGEKITTLDDQKIMLTKEDMVIADSEGPLAIAGIKGGCRADVDNKTKNIILEAGVFDATLVRATSIRHGIATDASIRFTRGMPVSGLEFAMHRLLELLASVSGGAVRGGTIDIQQVKAKQVNITLPLDRVESLLGIKIPDTQCIHILEALGCNVVKTNKKLLKVTAPAWRMDLNNAPDLVEEIGRIFGYDKINEGPSHALLLHPEEDNTRLILERVRDHFVSSGFSEIETYSQEPKRGHFPEVSVTNRLELENPLSEEFTHMRKALAPSVLANAKLNVKHADAISIFEIGSVFIKDGGKPLEARHICAVLASPKKNNELFYRAKGVVESLFARFGTKDLYFEDANGVKLVWPIASKDIMHMHRAAVVRRLKITLGAIYEVHPLLEVGSTSVVIELLVPELVSNLETETLFKPIPKYPAITRDIAVLVPLKIRMDEVTKIVHAAAGKLLVDLDLFDYYEGDKLGDDKKSLAFHLVFQSRERTLSDKDVATATSRIRTALENEDWEIRE